MRPPSQVLTLHLLGTVGAVVCLAWLGWRLVDQERLVEAQRAAARLEVAADRATRVLQRRLDELSHLLTANGDIPAGVVIFVTDGRSIRVTPPERFAFYPALPPAPSDALAGVFREGEKAEFSGHLEQAVDRYRVLASSPTPAVRAEALLRLGRTLRKSQRHSEALRAYDQLQRLAQVRVQAWPADLVAREARCRVLQEAGVRAELQSEAQSLRQKLAEGRWQTTSAQWESLQSELEAWAGPVGGRDRDADARALSAAAESLWTRWRTLAPAGHAIIGQGDAPVLVCWIAGDRLTAIFGGREYIETLRRQAAKEAGADVALADADGHALAGRVRGSQAIRPAGDTGLPFAVRVSTANPESQVREAGTRRRLLLATLALVGALILSSMYFTLRGIRRELAVARLQSDFVSAVSHEFRTPLTSLRQLSQMLAHGRVISEDRRQQYYDVLVRDSERLHRLVERLLTFGREESGAVQYRFETLDLVELARSIATEFERQADGVRVEASLGDSSCPVRAEREMLSLALWNLLDNAAKYSPDCRTVWLDLSRSTTTASLAVRDCGIGIPPDEQKTVFRKFVRGRATEESATKGAGIGLALVDRVVRAHGGRVRLDSEVGRGSTFTIELPHIQ